MHQCHSVVSKARLITMFISWVYHKVQRSWVNHKVQRLRFALPREGVFMLLMQDRTVDGLAERMRDLVYAWDRGGGSYSREQK